MPSQTPRLAMISGATRGIGAAVARELYDAGWQLSLGVRDLSGVDTELASSKRVLVTWYDACDTAAAGCWHEETLRWAGHVDALIHCAGVNSSQPFQTAQPDEIERVWRVNTLAPTMLAQAVLPSLRASHRGRVLLLASMSGKRVRNDKVAYSESKSGVVALAHTLRQEAWDDGVRVCVVCPSFVRTDMTAHATKIAPKEMTQPVTLAHLMRTIVDLPNEASVAELLVNCRLEDML
ncbi:SDR family NAD(P)-dependent oxidoreductase [Pseudoclavibacter sp. 13-3]|uniref:SDR family NAD(P)-dependent oxidoreductase n=1 Tax=Pseudoclavibacter sp. 13-3 TaxID=2901228 RepID=UPI001E2AD95A|nr:SDR family NAD(P)-dependent oxidoreductase [Pseudoclavibacter sp. 13-3]MCD7101297.1 SDR family NAD(P)-dependent oxidoreductase [Pseudoclavibacter sp. 13-3]